MMKRYLHGATACAASAIGLTVLAACGSAPTRIYAPYADSTRAAAASTYIGPAVRIDSVHLPPSLNRIEIVTDVAPGQKRINDMDQWSAPLTQLVRQTMTENLQARLPPGMVIFPHLSKPDGALGIEIDVLDFHAGERGASMSVSYTVSRSAGATTRGSAMLTDAGSGGATPVATVHALSALLGQLADRIAADVMTIGAAAGAPHAP